MKEKPKRKGCESYRYPRAQTSLVELHPWNSRGKCRQCKGDWWGRIYCTAPHLHRRSDISKNHGLEIQCL